MPGILKFLLSAVLAQGTHSVKRVEPPLTRTFPLLEAINNDDLITLENLLRAKHEQNRNFGIGTAVDYAHLYGKHEALKILRRYGGISAKELGTPTPMIMDNPSPRQKV